MRGKRWRGRSKFFYLGLETQENQRKIMSFFELEIWCAIFFRLAKQMRILYDDSFTKEDRITYKKFINVNIILSMRSLLVGMGRKEMGVEMHPDHAQILESLISQSSMLDQVLIISDFMHFEFGLTMFSWRVLPRNLRLGLRSFGLTRQWRSFFENITANFKFVFHVCGCDFAILTFSSFR